MAAIPNGSSPLRLESDTLSPLPDFHRQGLLAITLLGILSFVSSGGLFFYLSYKLAKWRLQPSAAPGLREEEEQATSNDLVLGLAQKNFGNGPPKLTVSEDVSSVHQQPQTQAPPQPPKKRSAPNQFLILIFNLLLADMHQATAFMLSARWVRSNAITVGTQTCWTQGWFVSTGDLASSCFTGAVAIYTYLVIVKNYRPPYRLLYSTIVSIWVFVYLMAILGVAITHNGRDAGGLYVRAAAWCWVNVEYETYRLWLHYFWMFLSLALTTVLYALIFYHLRPKPSSSSSGSRSTAAASNSHPAFLIYPLIYVSCTAPLALGRIVTMAGVHVSITYFLVAGALIASNGWLDVLLFATTRHTVIFDRPADSEDTGVDTFAFMRTPRDRQYGNMVWVQGGRAPTRQGGAAGAAEEADEEDGARGVSRKGRRGRRQGSSGWERIGDRMGWSGSGGSRGGDHSHFKSTSRDWRLRGPGSVSQESLRGSDGYAAEGGIQMDTVTTVVVEDKKPSLSTRAESAFSGEDTDKTVEPPQERSL